MNPEVTIHSVSFGGDGVTSLEGKVCFVEGALPGERVRVQILQTKKNLIRAKVLEILEKSPARETSPCVYVDRCGGCQYQHVRYEEELQFKQAQTSEVLHKIGGVDGDLVKPIVSGSSAYGYRNGVTLHFSPPAKVGGLRKKTDGFFGFVGRDNHSVVPVKSCLLADQRLASVFGVPLRKKSGVDKMTFKLSEKGEIFPDIDERFFRIQIGGRPLVASSQGFFQTNLGVTARIVETLSAWVREAAPDVFFDLYAGAGTFSFLSAEAVSKVVCVEESRANLDALRMNCQEQRKTPVPVFAGRVEKLFSEVFEKEHGAKNMIFMDPPRQGIDASFAALLSRVNAETIAYLSCDIATLARDLKILTNAGHFKVDQVVPFDMFPRTKHIEAMVLLKNI